MTDKEKIRAEIERLITMLRIGCKHSEANELLPILSFIDSLQYEPNAEETELNSLDFLEQLGYTCIPPKESWPPKDNTPTHASTEYKVSKELSTNPNMESSDAKCGKLTNPYSKYARVFRQLYDAGLPCGSRPTKIAQSWNGSDGKEFARSNGISALAGEPETLYEKMDSVAEEKSEIPTELEEEIDKYISENIEFDRVGSAMDKWNKGAHLNRFDIENIARHFAEWQKKQDQETIELAEDHAMLAGRMQMKEEMMRGAVEGSVVLSYIDRDGVSYCNIVSTDIPAEKYGLEEGSKCKFLILKDE